MQKLSGEECEKRHAELLSPSKHPGLRKTLALQTSVLDRAFCKARFQVLRRTYSLGASVKRGKECLRNQPDRYSFTYIQIYESKLKRFRKHFLALELRNLTAAKLLEQPLPCFGLDKRPPSQFSGMFGKLCGKFLSVPDRNSTQEYRIWAAEGVQRHKQVMLSHFLFMPGSGCRQI